MWASAQRCPGEQEDKHRIRNRRHFNQWDHAGLLFKGFNRIQLMISLVPSPGSEAQVKTPAQWSLEKSLIHFRSRNGISSPSQNTKYDIQARSFLFLSPSRPYLSGRQWLCGRCGAKGTDLTVIAECHGMTSFIATTAANTTPVSSTCKHF